MKTASDFLDYTFSVHPSADRIMQPPNVTVKLFCGKFLRYNFHGLLEMTDEQLDERYAQVFGRRAWHLTREGYISSLAREQAKTTNS